MTLLGQAELIGGILPNMIGFGILLLIFYFAKTGKMDEMLGWNKRIQIQSLDLNED